MPTEYTVGFMFDKDFQNVLLIRKLRPEWQKGKLNGIGGHIEKQEGPWEAQIREFNEEVINNNILEWKYYCKLTSNEFNVYCFACVGDLNNLKSKTDEKIEVIKVLDINPFRNDMIENLSWLISMAIDVLQDNRPFYSMVQY